MRVHTIHSERFHRLLKETSWIVLGQALAIVGYLVGVRLFTGLLTPDIYGELALVMTVATLINQIVLGPLANGVVRFYAPAVEQGDLCGYLNAVRRLVLLATVSIVFINLVTITCLLIVGKTKWIAVATATLIFAILSSYDSILSGIQNAARQRSIVALHQGMIAWGRYLVAAGLMLWLGATSTVAMVGFAVAVIPVLGSQYLFFRKIVPQNMPSAVRENNWAEQIWRFSWPYASWGIFSWAQQASDRWALGFFATTKEVGLYAVLFQLGYYPIMMATGIAMQLLAPIIFQRAGDGSDSQRNADVSKLSWRLSRYCLGLTVLAFGMAVLFHAQIFRIFVNKEYASVSYLLPWVLLSGGVFAVGQTLELNLASQMKTPTLVMAKIVTSLFGVLIYFAGALLLGIIGVVFASVFISLLYSTWIIVLSSRETKGVTI